MEVYRVHSRDDFKQGPYHAACYHIIDKHCDDAESSWLVLFYSKNTYKVLTLFLLKNEANQSQSSSYAPVLFFTASKYFFSSINVQKVLRKKYKMRENHLTNKEKSN